MPIARLELRRALAGDDLCGLPADCCPEPIRSGEVIFYRDHPVYPVRIHLLCTQRAAERAEADLVEYPTIRAARLDLQGRLEDRRCGVMLREPKPSASR